MGGQGTRCATTPISKTQQPLLAIIFPLCRIGEAIAYRGTIVVGSSTIAVHEEDWTCRERAKLRYEGEEDSGDYVENGRSRTGRTHPSTSTTTSTRDARRRIVSTIAQ